MKLKDLQAGKAKFYLKHPVTLDPIITDDGDELFWYVVGQDSDEYLQAQQDFLKHLETLGEDADKMTSIDYKNQVASQLAAMVKGWDEKFNDCMDGPYNPEYIEELLHKAELRWMVTQLDAFVSQRRHFFTK